MYLQLPRQILHPTLSSHSRGVDNDLMLSRKAEIQVRTGILSLSNLHLGWYNFADMNQSFKCNGLNFRPESGQSHLVNMSFNATTVRRIGRWTEDEKRISKSFLKRKGTRLSAWKRELWEKAQGSRMAFMLQNTYRGFEGNFWLWNFPHLFIIYIVCPGRSVERMCLLRVVWKGRNRAGEGNAVSAGSAQTHHWNPDLPDSSRLPLGTVSGPGLSDYTLCIACSTAATPL